MERYPKHELVQLNGIRALNGILGTLHPSRDMVLSALNATSRAMRGVPAAVRVQEAGMFLLENATVLLVGGEAVNDPEVVSALVTASCTALRGEYNEAVQRRGAAVLWLNKEAIVHHHGVEGHSMEAVAALLKHIVRSPPETVDHRLKAALFILNHAPAATWEASDLFQDPAGMFSLLVRLVGCGCLSGEQTVT